MGFLSMGEIGEKSGLYRRWPVLVVLWRSACNKGGEKARTFLFLNGFPATFQPGIH